MHTGNCQSKQSDVPPSEHRPKWDEIIIYAGQGSKIPFSVSSAVILDKRMRRNKASNIHPSKQVDASGNDVTCIQEVLCLNLDHGTDYPD
jgi:hypothetical protein